MRQDRAPDQLCDLLEGEMGMRVAAEADDMAMLRLLARANAGLAVIPRIVVRDELASGRFIELGTLEGLHEEFFAITLHRRFPTRLSPNCRAHMKRGAMVDR